MFLSFLFMIQTCSQCHSYLFDSYCESCQRYSSFVYVLRADEDWFSCQCSSFQGTCQASKGLYNLDAYLNFGLVFSFSFLTIYQYHLSYQYDSQDLFQVYSLLPLYLSPDHIFHTIEHSVHYRLHSIILFCDFHFLIAIHEPYSSIWCLYFLSIVL